MCVNVYVHVKCVKRTGEASVLETASLRWSLDGWGTIQHHLISIWPNKNLTRNKNKIKSSDYEKGAWTDPHPPRHPRTLCKNRRILLNYSSTRHPAGNLRLYIATHSLCPFLRMYHTLSLSMCTLAYAPYTVWAQLAQGNPPPGRMTKQHNWVRDLA